MKSSSIYLQSLSCNNHSLSHFISRMIFQTFVLTLPLLYIVDAEHWGYDPPTGPLEWPTIYPDFCAGSQQSPINIETSAVTCQSSNIRFVNYEFNLFRRLLANLDMINNGHTVQISGGYLQDSYLKTKFDGVSADYDFLQFHFHWGENSSVGSEHTINNNFYPLELHIVHVNRKYNGTTDFLKNKDGMAVVGIFFELTNRDNRRLNSVINNLKDVRTAGATKKLGILNSITLSQFLPDNLRAFHYKGSLTTPNCNEVVNWIVLAEPIPISQRQLDRFHLLKEGDEGSNLIVKNYRPVLPVNGRKVCSAKGVLG